MKIKFELRDLSNFTVALAQYADKYTLHYSDETTQDVLTFGDGHQAILNMMVTTALVN